MPTLTVEPLGAEIEVNEDQTILDACLRRGIWLPHACTHGRCSTCKVDVLDGEVDHGDASAFALMDFEREEGKTLACTARLRSDATIEAEVEEDDDAELHPVQDYVGVVAETAMLTPDIRRVDLELPSAGIAFQAGQYVNLHIPGLERPRAFSIASAPSNPRRLELHVRRVPGGPGTAWLHEVAEKGMEVRFTGPLGRFFVRRSLGKPMIFVAGGSGLSSPQSMVLDELERGGDQPITLIHGARRADGLYHRAALEALAKTHDRFRYVPALSEDAPPGWTGERGMAHEVLERLYEGRFAGHAAYLCGPPPMIEACIRTLMRGRLFEKDIFTEKFVSEADGEAALAKSPLFKRI
jgi:phenol hydroxylase P5 protein